MDKEQRFDELGLPLRLLFEVEAATEDETETAPQP